jgi:Flp pilus assembly protein TadD
MLAEAVIHFRDALRLDPSLDDTYRDLGLALQLQEDWPQAADSFRHALDLRPENAEYHRSLAYCLERMGQTESARAEYQESLRLDPSWPQTVLREAWELATHPDSQRRNGRLAVQRADQVLQGTGQRDPRTLDTLAAAYAEAGQFTVAGTTAREALAQAVAGSRTNLIKQIEERLALYQKAQPFHAASP